ncbi:hypothetical protein KFL_000350170 [Klebsormidium nitens]|uniref:F-box domain-containing protein n=1 Tax=Klebsormidium nitens TaxID=105231 RepID=A0A1Y1HRN9_KLENI|nr:hypothetical protein KFL_000350170 [Klebsormidium nitens]|eukprot:GAQ79661.1 hypothetical protein KFL_000350170 [Klebsormidium nitens]
MIQIKRPSWGGGRLLEGKVIGALHAASRGKGAEALSCARAFSRTTFLPSLRKIVCIVRLSDMDTDIDYFQLLPDELVIKVLTEVNSPHRNTGDQAVTTSARDFVRAQSVCKRFLELTRAVKKLNWQLGDMEQSIGLARFLEHPEVNLQELSLVMTTSEVKAVPSHVLFTTQLIEGLPERVNFHFIGKMGEPELDITMLIAYVLISPVLEHLSVSSEGGAVPAVNSMHNRPPSQLKSLQFNSVSIQPEALEHLLMRCSKIEVLKVLLGGNANRWPPSNEPEIVSIRSGTLKKLVLNSKVGVAARIKSESLVSLENQSERLALATPALANVVIDARSLSLQNPVRWAQPLSLEHLCFKGVETLGDWQVKVVPLLRQCAELQTLDFVDGEVKLTPESDTLPFEVFVGHLPPRLTSLKVSSGLLQLLNLTEASSVSHSRLQWFRVTSKLEIGNLVRFKQLGTSFPNANILQA